MYEAYSQKLKKLNKGNQVDVYRYDNITREFLRQVLMIIENAIGEYAQSKPRGNYPNNVWIKIHQDVAMEVGVYDLGTPSSNAYFKCREYLEKVTIVERALDFIEISFRIITTKENGYLYGSEPQEVIDKLNYRFKAAGLGYQFVNGEIMRIDSQFLHSEAVLPVLTLLSDPKFKTAEEEFTQAHSHYRKGEYEDAIVDAERAFESVMKIILTERGWTFDSKDAANKLLDHLITQNNLVPTDFKDGLAGLPRIRNRFAGHGQGSNQVVVPEHYASYALHLAASNILFLIEAYQKP